MAGELILLTGGTGHIGYRTLVEALRKGYNVRVALYLGQLSIVVVPQIEETGAFDEAVKGVDYIVHVASPLPTDSEVHEGQLIQPAIRGTLSILESALKEPNIKNVVITSSLGAVRPDEARHFTADNIEPDPQGPYPNGFAAYLASKKLAYNRTRDFIAREQPTFAVINIMPSFVIGKNELATTPEAVRSGSNQFALISVLGGSNPAGTPASACHVDDVAFVHIAALDPTIQGHRNFGVNYQRAKPIEWDDSIEIVKKHFPQAVEKGIFPLGGVHKTFSLPFDASKTEEVFRRQV